MQEALSAPCPKCHGKRTMTELLARDFLKLVRPRTMGFWRKDRLDLKGIVCINCGYTELYAENPGNYPL
ncbi:hypothetical protein KDA_40360 [Dictyobacter alpinus]|uniref:Uncharacterized protein n=1 Tax=Dictyobacter alpinus TaxID=2014873 RepID=A0A402BB81_9CHLR|nr:hypothetical protein KDA_40360 [Dictyobacter alpinus]